MVRLGIGCALVLVTILAVRAWDAWRSPSLSLWHTEVPDELDADAIDASDWQLWMASEARVFGQVRSNVTDKLPPDDRIPANRYFAGSPMHASHFGTDWNRSYVLMPDGAPRGAAVLLHGLTDSPYSLRHIGDGYRSNGFVVVSIRMPGHGTVPAGLTRVHWEDWAAATRLAVRHARTLAGDEPLHLVGYSNGGALALHYSLESLVDERLARPDQIVLLSPMVGITSFARFAGVLGWPAVFPGFAKAAWLYSAPEYNPFKYNSFPVNGARQSSQLVAAMQKELLQRVEAGGLGEFPPVLAFQSAIDATVSTRAVFDFLAVLPDNGSELVLFDRNRAAVVGPLVDPASAALVDELVKLQPQRFTLSLITNSADAMEVRRYAPVSGTITREAIAQRYPDDMYSLSHVALPFPMDDGLYGREPSTGEFFGVHLGTVAVRGERGSLVVGVETLMRATSNPFFDYQVERLRALMLEPLPAQP